MSKITIIGGDKRLIKAKSLLEEKGYIVDSIGLCENDDGNAETSDILLFPVPTTKDGELVYCPNTNRKIYLKDFFKYDNKLFLTARYKFLKKRSIDYCEYDYYSVLNAVPTAEGAIAYAINKTDFTLFKSRVLVIGYGRTGKVLTERLSGFKCDLTVSARKESDFAQIEALNYKYIHTYDLIDGENTPNFDIIFNTVDIFTYNVSPEKLRNTLFIDLSSSGGIKADLIEKYEINYHKLPALPGKTAPDTAGEILARTVMNIIKGEYQ